MRRDQEAHKSLPLCIFFKENHVKDIPYTVPCSEAMERNLREERDKFIKERLASKKSIYARLADIWPHDNQFKENS